jgi:surface antigen
MDIVVKKPVGALVIASLLLTGCVSGKEGTGQVVGTALATGLCLALVDARHNAACLAAAAAGFLIGGAIGHQMDERDRERREAAVRAALNNERLWAHRQADEPLPESAVNAMPVSKTKPNKDAVTKNAAEWHNPDTDNSGRIEPLRTYVGGAKHDQVCRQYRETYFKNGEPVVETEQSCKDAQGHWH